METVKGNIEVVLYGRIPNRKEIISRMLRMYQNKSKLLESVIAPCAEVTESLLCDIITSSIERKRLVIKREKMSGRFKTNRPRLTGYSCPKCNYPYVRLDDNYCGGCGKQIEWDY